MMTLSIRLTDAPLGAEIHGADLSRPLDDATFATIRTTLDERGVMVLRELRKLLDTAARHCRSGAGGSIVARERADVVVQHVGIHVGSIERGRVSAPERELRPARLRFKAGLRPSLGACCPFRRRL